MHILGLQLLGLIKASIQMGCTSQCRLFIYAVLVNLRVWLIHDFSKRVFVLGPSHHVYMDGCALPTVSEYATPIGNLPLDLASECL